MDRWSVASLGQRTDIIRSLRQQQRREVFKKEDAKKHKHSSSPFDRTMLSTETPGTTTMVSSPTPSRTLHRQHGEDTPQTLRLSRALGILRRLAKQDEVLEERANLCELTFGRLNDHAKLEPNETTTSSAAQQLLSDKAHASAVDDEGALPTDDDDTGRSAEKDDGLPQQVTGVSVFRIVERQWQRCVTEFEVARIERAAMTSTNTSSTPITGDDNEGEEEATEEQECGDGASSPEDRAVEAAIEKGATLDLSGVALRLSHLPAMVEFITAAATNAATSSSRSHCNAKGQQHLTNNESMRCQLRMPLRTVDLTDLETCEQSGPASRLEASRIVAHLCKLLQDVPSIVVMHLSEHCALLESHCAELQKYLEKNLETLRMQIRRRVKSRVRMAARAQRNERDELVNFFLWENTDRCGIMELDKTFRRDAKKAMKTAAETTLRRAQEKFTQQRLAVARQEFFDYVQGSMTDYYRQSLSGLIRQQLKFLQQQELRDRNGVVSSMSTALDSLVTANKISLHRLQERLRNSESSRRESVLALLREERASRARECGAVSAFHLLTSMILHFKLLKGHWTNIFEARGELFLGPYMMPWMMRRVSFVTFTNNNTHGPDVDTAAPPMPDFASPADVVDETPQLDASIRSPGKKTRGETAGGGGDSLGESFRAARPSVFNSSVTSSGGGGAAAGGGQSLTDVSGVADAIIAVKRTTAALSPTGSVASRRSSHAPSPRNIATTTKVPSTTSLSPTPTPIDAPQEENTETTRDTQVVNVAPQSESADPTVAESHGERPKNGKEEEENITARFSSFRSQQPEAAVPLDDTEKPLGAGVTTASSGDGADVGSTSDATTKSASHRRRDNGGCA